jgi:hypothetical protein
MHQQDSSGQGFATLQAAVTASHAGVVNVGDSLWSQVLPSLVTKMMARSRRRTLTMLRETAGNINALSWHSHTQQ